MQGFMYLCAFFSFFHLLCTNIIYFGKNKKEMKKELVLTRCVPWVTRGDVAAPLMPSHKGGGRGPLWSHRNVTR